MSLKCLVHPIIFHRALTKTEPEEVFEELIDLVYVRPVNIVHLTHKVKTKGTIADDVDQKIDKFVERVKEGQKSNIKNFQVHSGTFIIYINS